MKYIPTGNEYVALDRIAEDTASIEAFSVLHMGYKGMLEVQSGKESSAGFLHLHRKKRILL